MSSIASIFETEVSEAPYFNSYVPSFQNFTSSVLCQLGAVLGYYNTLVQVFF
jgi:hypothetical protein